MDSVQMRWVECPLVDAAGVTLPPPPQHSDDDDDDDDSVDLLNQREGHCSAVVYPAASMEVSAALLHSPPVSWVLVCGGYSKGTVSAAPLVSRTNILPALQWVRLPPVDALECDGATLTTVASMLAVEAVPTTTKMLTASSPVQTAAARVAYLFGGLDAHMNRRRTLYAVTLRVDDDERPLRVQVEEVKCTGTIPEARVRHSAGGHGGNLYIFGGETDTHEQSSDLYVCDVQTGVWRALVSPSSLPSPSPRLLSGNLLFVAPTVFVLYGGSHFVNGDISSFADVWSFDLTTVEWLAVVPPQKNDCTPSKDKRHILPPSNGHAGGVLVLRLSDNNTCVCAAFLGGKNVSEGDDAVKLVCFHVESSMMDACTRLAAPSEAGGSSPHWRYTPAVVNTEKGLLLLAGQCRHPQVPSAWLLTVACSELSSHSP